MGYTLYMFATILIALALAALALIALTRYDKHNQAIITEISRAECRLAQLSHEEAQFHAAVARTSREFYRSM